MRLPHDIRRLRGEASQAAFGAQIGVHRNTVANWEAGVTPELAHLQKLVSLGLPKHHLLGTTQVASAGPEAAA